MVSGAKSGIMSGNINNCDSLNGGINTVELQRRLVAVVPGEKTLGLESIRLIKLNANTLSVYQIEEEDDEGGCEGEGEGEGDSIDDFFFPSDVKRIKTSTLLFQGKRQGMNAFHDSTVATSPKEKAVKHKLMVSRFEEGDDLLRVRLLTTDFLCCLHHFIRFNVLTTR